MGVGQAIDLTAEHRKTVLALLERHLPGTPAWAYGSRTTWTSRPQSDLDLVVFATPEQRRPVGDLREAFEESSLPFRVDLFVWGEVPAEFQGQIRTKHIVLTAGSNHPVLDGHSGSRDPWSRTPFGHLLAEPVRNGIYKRGEFHGRGTKIVNMGEIFAHPRLGSVPMKRVELSESEKQRFLIAKGDLLFARRSLVAEGAGKCCVVLDVDEPTAFESSIIRARPDGLRSDSLFLYYFFTSPSGLHSLDTIRRQVAVSGVTGKDLSNLDIPVPSAVEQRAIAHILGTLDDKIELNRRMNATLEAIERALFRSWFVDFDPVRAKMEGRDTGLLKEIADLFPDRLADSEMGEIPKGWKAGTLSGVASLNPESWKSSSPPRTISYVDLTSAKWGCIENTETYTWGSAPSRARRVLRRGDTIVATVRPGNGSFALIDEDGLTASTGFVVLRPMQIYDRDFVWCAATSADNISRLTHLADGGAYPAIRPEAVLATPVVLPDYDVRNAFATRTGAMLDRIETNKRQSRVLAALRDTLLPKLVSGEIRLRGDEKFVGAIA